MGVRVTRVRWATALALSALIVLAAPPARAAAQGLPDIAITLAVEFQDVAGWLALHQEILGTVPGTKLLQLTLPTSTGGARSVTVSQPAFTVHLVTTDGRRVTRLMLTGKVSGGDAVATLTPFEEAAAEVQAGTVQNRLTLSFGLSEAVGQLLELNLSRS